VIVVTPERTALIASLLCFINFFPKRVQINDTPRRLSRALGVSWQTALEDRLGASLGPLGGFVRVTGYLGSEAEGRLARWLNLLPPPPLFVSDDPACGLALFARFTLSYRDVEELLAERGLDISCETVRCWVLKIGP
jgi:hypothetical protein